MRIAIVDGYSTGRVLVEKLLQAGAECVHVQSRDQIHDYYRSTFQPGHYVVDLGFRPDPEAVARDLVRLGVVRVLPGTEVGVELSDRLSSLLGTPGNDPQLAAASVDKALMAEIVERDGLLIPRSRAFDEADAAVAWSHEEGISASVVKPVDSAGTDNVVFCEDAAGIRSAVDRILGTANVYGVSNTQFIIQERVFGIEYYANTVSHDGVHKMVEMWRYHKSERSGTPIYDYEEPVYADDDVWQDVRSFVFEVLDSLGIRSGAAHTEIILTDKGPTLIETGARLGGATMPDVVAEYCGHSQTDMLVAAVMDSSTFMSFDDTAIRRRCLLRNVSLCNEAPGIVTEDDWRAEIMKLPSAVALVSRLAAGDHLAATSNLIDAPGYVYLAGDPAAVDADYRSLRDMELSGLYTRSSGDR